MKYAAVKKFLAFLLATCSIVAVLACGGTAMMLESYDLYTDSLEDKQEQWYYNTGYPLAWQSAQRHAALAIGECSEALVERLYEFSWTMDLSHYYITVWEGDNLVYSISEPISGVTCEYSITPEYPKVVGIYIEGSKEETEEEPEEEEETQPQEDEPPFWEFSPVREDRVDLWEDGQRLIYELYYYTGPTYRVEVTMAPEALRDTFHSNLATYYPHRYTLIWAAAAALLLTAATMVYLVCIAGKTKDGQLRPGGLNRLPLDVYLLLGGALAFFPGKIALEILYRSSDISFLAASLILVCGTFVCLLGVAVIFALAAQVKLGGGYWWRHTVLGMCAGKVWSWLKALGRGIATVFRMLPVIWQWMLPAAIMVAITMIAFLLGSKSNSPVMFAMLFTCCILAVALVCYGGYSFGIILLGARKMSRGDLRHKIPTRYLIAGFRDCAEQLNALSETARISTQRQLRAERMKTELITNVSHDIKTPLTTIISFVDLLEKANTEEQRKQYLEVLSRQSQQLKKLIEDLIELSKASTGNMQANITQLNAGEAVNQALGEFSDKLAAARLTPIFRAPQEPVMMAADGRLTWRVLSNLLSNVVKYATPDTRVYVEVEEKEQQVLLSIKNISREELQVPAEDLLERFVQGDSSRNKEGSGLGLNIAKSLMEVQQGKLELLLDGDLFKVTLIFPAS